MEVCTKGTKCKANDDDGWQSVDDMPAPVALMPAAAASNPASTP
jgi:hypothetical protein